MILWTKQIKAVLKQEPDAAAARGEVGAGTRAQLAFWARKAEGLNSLRGQLRAERIARAVAALEATKSTLHPAFDRLCKDVARAQEEANDNLTFLRPAAKQFEQLLVRSVIAHGRLSLSASFFPFCASPFLLFCGAVSLFCIATDLHMDKHAPLTSPCRRRQSFRGCIGCTSPSCTLSCSSGSTRDSSTRLRVWQPSSREFAMTLSSKPVPTWPQEDYGGIRRRWHGV